MKNKKILTIIGFSAIATISFQTWVLINNQNIKNPFVSKIKIESTNQNIQQESLSNVNQNDKNNNVLSKKNIETQLDEQDNTFISTNYYQVQEDNNSITLHVKLKDKIIKDIKIFHYDDSPTSKKKHDMFDLKVDLSKVLGKNISDAQIANVTGASYTSRAFNEILKDIEANL